jgi:hypothetical protein
MVVLDIGVVGLSQQMQEHRRDGVCLRRPARWREYIFAFVRPSRHLPLLAGLHRGFFAERGAADHELVPAIQAHLHPRNWILDWQPAKGTLREDGYVGYYSAAAFHAQRQGALSWRIR